ncbi:MAG: peptidyl-prolyl cis-trans isomerase [Myxococcaceae bacterium]
MRWLRVLVVASCLVGLLACEQQHPMVAKMDFRRAPPVGVTGGTWVAKWSGQQLTDAELNQRFNEMNPYARARFQTVEQRRDYVDGVVRFELLAQEAVKRGLQNDPEVVEAARRVMVQQLLKKELDEGHGGVTDAQVAQWYEAHKSDYVKPSMTRLAHIAFKKEDRAKAEDALVAAKALNPLDAAAFGKMAREQSADPKTKELDGDMRFLSDDELATQYGPEVRDAAAKLVKVGDVSEGLVETANALHVLKLQGRQLALNLSLEQAKPSIQQLLANESKQERFRALVDKLKSDAKLEVNDPALAAMVIDPKAPALPSSGPAPGFIPAPPPTK